MDDVKILVAEDEPLIRNNIIKKIRTIGAPFSVAGHAEDGATALDLSRRLYPDILITDIRMPEQDGLSLAATLKASYPALQVIVITGYDDFSYVQSALRSGVLDFLVKPVNIDELRAALFRAKELLDLEYSPVDTNVRIRSRSPQSAEDIVRRMTRYISEHFRERISVHHLAEIFGYSPDHVTRLFGRVLGISPSHYIAEQKVREAVRLLRAHKNAPISQIAEMAGFDDPAYFSRTIKRITGKSPSRLRDQHSE